MYERVWDEADYVVPPAENGAFFIMTNVVVTPNQTRTVCPEDPEELPELICNATTWHPCRVGVSANLVKGHGVMTGKCVQSDRKERKRESKSREKST
jgi:P2X purinoceptor 4